MKIKNREQVEGLIMAALDKLDVDSRINSHICQNIDGYSPTQLATLVDYLVSWHDKKIRKQVFKVLNRIRYIEDNQITNENIPCIPLGLPILYSTGSLVAINYYGDETLAVVVGAPTKKTRYFDFSDECYLAWIIPRNEEEVETCYGYDFSVDHLLEGRFHEHPHILECKPVYVDDLSRYGEVEWLHNCISICKQAIKELEE